MKKKTCSFAWRITTKKIKRLNSKAGEIQTTAKKKSRRFDTILSFLDKMPPLELPKDLESFLTEETRSIGTKQIGELLENTKKSIENPEEFLSGQREIVEQYLA